MSFNSDLSTYIAEYQLAKTILEHMSDGRSLLEAQAATYGFHSIYLRPPSLEDLEEVVRHYSIELTRFQRAQLGYRQRITLSESRLNSVCEVHYTRRRDCICRACNEENRTFMRSSANHYTVTLIIDTMQLLLCAYQNIRKAEESRRLKSVSGTIQDNCTI